MGQEHVLTPISKTRFGVAGTSWLRTRALVVLAAVTALAIADGEAVSQAQRRPAATGADWPQWRGPTRDGFVGAALPARWPDRLKKRWEVSVGAGHASPVVSGDRVVVIAREGDREIVRALDVASGEDIWRAAYAAPFTVNPAAQSHGPGPKATPAIAGGRVFAFGIGGVLSAFEFATGKLLWRVPAPAVLPQYGTATSPLADGASVIVHVGGQDNGALTSFDAATGKPRWEWKGDGPGSGSPIIATLGGVRQVIAQTQKLLVGLDAANGALLWQMPFTTDFDQNAFTPVVFQDLLIFGGIDRPLTAIRPKLAGGTWSAELVWTNLQTPMFTSSPVVIEGTLYGLTMRGKGQFVAIDAANGKTLWSTQGREGEHASLMGSRSWLLASTTDGNLVVARANPHKYEEVRRYQIAESALWAHPAVTGGSIIVKDVDKVICWDF
jgi:outer membrane protein assembly factor BamB